MKAVKKHRQKTLKISLVLSFLSVLCLSGPTFALNANGNKSPSNESLGLHLRDINESSYHSVLQPLRQAQARQAQTQLGKSSTVLRSKSEVMQEVKSSYNGQVVKMSLDEKTATYSVRVLLPNGKVKNISVSARK